MALDRIRFVDGISASPTVLLDLNDEVSWAVPEFDAPPPALRYSESSSMLRDGAHISASAYENRTISLTAELIVANQDTLGTELQKLARIIDTDKAWLEYRRVGATSSVFFRTLRADVSQVEQLIGPAAANTFTLRIPAEPFALGVRVDAVASATLTNNPAAGSNGLFINVTAVQGDVATEPLIWTPSATGFGNDPLWLATEPAPPGGIYFAQAESAGGLGADTTVQANDAAMSGTGSNYVRTSFATSTPLNPRLTGLVLPTALPPGDYRILARVRASASGSVFTIRPVVEGGNPVGRSVEGATTTVTGLTTTLKVVDLGILPIPAGRSTDRAGFQPTTLPALNPGLALDAGRTSGTASLDYDYLVAVPAQWRSGAIWRPLVSLNTAGAHVVDGPNDTHYFVSTTSPFDAAAKFVTATTRQPQITGSLPILFPNVTNRLHMVPLSGAIGDTYTVNVSYWPKYLYVRPAST